MVTINKLIWDEWNVSHIARHSVKPNEVEEICYGDPLVQQGNKGRIVLIGPTISGQIIEVVLDPEPNEGVYYVVTAHVASKKDRILYQKTKGGVSI